LIDVVLDASETLSYRCDSLLNVDGLIDEIKTVGKTSDVHV